MFVKIFQKWVSYVLSCRIFSYRCFQLLWYPKKTANISREHHRVSREIKPAGEVAKCPLFSVSSASSLTASPHEHVFLVKENLQKHNRFASYAESV